MKKIVNMAVNKTVDMRYYIQLDIMSHEGVYSESFTFHSLYFFKWIDNPTSITKLIMEYHGEYYSKSCDTVCFKNKNDAEFITNKLLSLYVKSVIENNS